MQRRVSMDQVTAGPLSANREGMTALAARMLASMGRDIRIIAKPVGDATGGDVYEPVNSLEAALASAARAAGHTEIIVEVEG